MEHTKAWHSARRKRIFRIILFSLFGLLIIGRLMLPTLVKNYVNKVLSNMDGYTGSIDDIDIWIIRGAYVIKDLKLDKINGKIPVPFITAKTIDLSIEWRALFKGAVKGKAIFNEAYLNFVAGPDKSSSQTGAETDWTAELKKLLPIQINRFEIHNSKISYLDFHSKPKVDVHINSFNLIATNLSNLDNPDDKLPSVLNAEGITMGHGKLFITGNMNVLKEIPDAAIKLKLTDLDLPALNNLFKAYGKFEFEKGTFSVFSELSLDNSHVLGYVKPIMVKMNVKNWQEEKGNALQKLWVVIVGVTFDVFKNHPKDQFATKVPIEGDLNNIKPGIINALINIIHNGFIKAYDSSFDNTVTFGHSKEKEDKNIFDIFKKKK
jgi:hypothetical protein